jgi:hypothetical protein
MNIIKDWFTARNGIDWSLTKLVGIAASLAMVANFLRTSSVDFQGFGTGISLLMAALAAKYFVEDKDQK